MVPGKPRLDHISYVFGGAFFANAAPHAVSGMMAGVRSSRPCAGRVMAASGFAAAIVGAYAMARLKSRPSV
jgi:hypothetical protein